MYFNVLMTNLMKAASSGLSGPSRGYWKVLLTPSSPEVAKRLLCSSLSPEGGSTEEERNYLQSFTSLFFHIEMGSCRNHSSASAAGVLGSQVWPPVCI